MYGKVLLAGVSLILLLIQHRGANERLSQEISQGASIKGRVYRSDTNQPITGVKVVLLNQVGSNQTSVVGHGNPNMETKTDENGRYSFESVKAGKYCVGVETKYENEKDLPCHTQKDRFTNNGAGVTAMRDGADFVEIATSRDFSVATTSRITKDFDLSCKRRLKKRK